MCPFSRRTERPDCEVSVSLVEKHRAVIDNRVPRGESEHRRRTHLRTPYRHPEQRWWRTAVPFKRYFL